MNLAAKPRQRAVEGRPFRVGLTSAAGKFGAMFLAQARLMPGLHVVGLADWPRPGVRLTRGVSAGEPLLWKAADIGKTVHAIRVRREMETEFGRRHRS